MTYSRSAANVMLPCGTRSTRPSMLRDRPDRHRRDRVHPRAHPDLARLAVAAHHPDQAERVAPG